MTVLGAGVAALWKAFEAGILALDPKSCPTSKNSERNRFLTGNSINSIRGQAEDHTPVWGAFLGKDYKNSSNCFLEHSHGEQCNWF